jgi:hypothetical protein
VAIRGETLELATRRTVESAAPAAHPSVVTAIERSSGCSSLAILERPRRGSGQAERPAGVMRHILVDDPSAFRFALEKRVGRHIRPHHTLAVLLAGKLFSVTMYQ